MTRNYTIALTDEQIHTFVVQLFGRFQELIIHRVDDKIFLTVRYEYGFAERGIVLRNFEVNVIGNNCNSYSSLYRSYMKTLFGSAYTAGANKYIRQARCLH